MNKILVFFMLAFASLCFAQTNATTPSTSSNSTTTQDQNASAPAATSSTQSTTGAQSNSGMQTNSGTQAATDNSNAQTSGKVADRLNASATALQEIFAASDKGVPENLLSHAKCVVMIPGMKKAGFVVGGRYGRGFATCRTSSGWSAPAPVSLSGGSYGLQIGGESVDVLMLVMNDQGVQHLLSSKFKIGVDANAAAGPIGRSASADTDWKLNSEILTYSRSRGLFAGLELNGAEVKQDNDTTRELYGRAVPFQALLSGNMPAPAAATAFTNEVAKDFSQARANQ